MSGVSGYVVDEWINGGWQRIGNFGSGVTSDPVTGLSPGTTYYFNVGASNSTGTTWGNSQSDATLDVSPPAAPSFTLTAVSSTQINIAWSDVSGAGGYAVEEWINGGWSQIDNVSANSNAVNGGGATTNAEIPGGNDPVTGLSPDTTYDFRVGAYNSGGTSWAIDQTATTLQSTAFLTGSAWSGYVIVPGSQVTQVSGSWVLPADIASTGADSRTAIWVGIDGYGGKTVEQIGTTWHASTGTWTAWVELAGDAIYNAQGVPIAKGGYYASQTVSHPTLVPLG